MFPAQQGQVAQQVVVYRAAVATQGVRSALQVHRIPPPRQELIAVSGYGQKQAASEVPWRQARTNSLASANRL